MVLCDESKHDKFRLLLCDTLDIFYENKNRYHCNAKKSQWNNWDSKTGFFVIIRTYALYKLTMICVNDIWSFQAFGD